MTTPSVLIIGAVWVEPNSSAAGSRMLQLIEQFQKQEWKITFASSAQKSANEINLRSYGIDEVSIELNNTSFDAFVKKLNPTIVVFDRFMIEEQFGWRVAENCPQALRILDTEDLHFLRKVRYEQYKKGVEFNTTALLKSDFTKREIASILRCDLSLIISTYEMDLLKNTFNIDEDILHYLPFLLENIDENQQKKWLPFEQRHHFVFVGNFFHKPNVDAVLTLKKEIWSKIKKHLPNAEMHIYGAYVNQQIRDLHNAKEGFIVKGFAEDSQTVVSRAKVVLAPLNFGAGIKGKLTEAMVCGTPSVTTSIGAEGMYGGLSWNGFITDDYSDFAKKAVQLYTDENLWNVSQRNGVAIINQMYDKEKLGVNFMQRIEKIQENLAQHRTQNFLGSLIQHQTLQATKYMSKWIEAKNKTNL